MGMGNPSCMYIADLIDCISHPSLEMAPLVLSIHQMSLGDVTFSQDSPLASNREDISYSEKDYEDWVEYYVNW